MSKLGFQAFAAGMIVATSVLGGTYLLSDHQSATADSEQKEVTEKQVNQFLKSNGQVSITSEEYEELLALKKVEVVQEDSQNQQQTETAKETEQPKEAEEKKEEVIKYNITIKEGMTTSEVSDLLEQNAIIASSFEFDQFLIKNNFHTRVQLGTFEVQKGMTFQQLAEAITR
ncbi:endolytic transglycosylase MltG [Metabacillus litoralis]|uniref:endolytic transglycosylase MltG n=1 Tax=Metabacillus litoralis TaxID=152268 RepID=UPI000EF62C1D|nr:endolytic transglycosylase MltG [Metabacillus litoralis]